MGRLQMVGNVDSSMGFVEADQSMRNETGQKTGYR